MSSQKTTLPATAPGAGSSPGWQCFVPCVGLLVACGSSPSGPSLEQRRAMERAGAAGAVPASMEESVGPAEVVCAAPEEPIGEFLLAVEASARMEELRGCTHVEGDLDVGSFVGVDWTALSSLRVVTGELIVRGPFLSDVILADGPGEPIVDLGFLAGLESVGGLGLIDVDVRQLPEWPAFEPLSLLQLNTPNLESLPGFALAEGAALLLSCPLVPRLDRLELPSSLSEVRLSQMPLASWDFLNAVEAVETLSLFGLPLASLAGLEHLNVAERLVIYDLPLESLDGLGAPDMATREVDLADLPLTRLRPIATTGLSLRNLPRLPDLQGVGKGGDGDFSLFLADLPTFESLRGLDELGSAAIHLELVELPALRSLDGIESLEGGSLGLWNIPVASLEGGEALTELQQLVLRENPTLESLSSLAGLQSLGKLEIESNPALTALPEFSELTTLPSVLIARNERLRLERAFPLVTTADDIVIAENPALGQLDSFESLEQVESLLVADNAELSSLAMPALATVRTLSVNHNPELVRVELSALQEAERVQFRCNLKLPQPTLNELFQSEGVSVELYDYYGNAESDRPCSPFF